jgi:hypothetical protein
MRSKCLVLGVMFALHGGCSSHHALSGARDSAEEAPAVATDADSVNDAATADVGIVDASFVDSALPLALDAQVDAGEGNGPSGCQSQPRTSWGASDVGNICAVRCFSTAPDSDVVVAIDTVQGNLVAHVVQTKPAPCDEIFANVTTSWSGHFFNFFGSNNTWSFHLLTVGASSATMDNTEVYSDPSTESGGPVNVYSLSCSIYAR